MTKLKRKKKLFARLFARNSKAAKFVAPFVPPVMCFLVLCLSFAVPVWGANTPTLALIPIYYYSMLKTENVGMLTIMFLGFAQDLISGGAFGLNIFLFLILHFAVAQQKIFPIVESKLFAFLIFAGTSGLLALLKVIIVSVFILPRAGMGGAFYAWLWLVAMYLPIVWLLERITLRQQKEIQG
ncbi:MAG: rod shape-determining protein MreD [Alphaproteobacteria bacterium]|nr:rod shape-determining protein MreD [Alphaproteobacteria bacterium]